MVKSGKRYKVGSDLFLTADLLLGSIVSCRELAKATYRITQERKQTKLVLLISRKDNKQAALPADKNVNFNIPQEVY